MNFILRKEQVERKTTYIQKRNDCLYISLYFRSEAVKGVTQVPEKVADVGKQLVF